MKDYPSIGGPHSGRFDSSCYAFVKYDGSNLRFQYSRKRGWYKFGIRNTLFDQTHPIFGPAIPVFLEKYSASLEEIFKDKQFRGVNDFVVFAEWFGAKSLGGMHFPDDPHDIVIFDVNPIKKDFISPKDFIDIFGHLPVAEMVWSGIYDQDFIDSVKQESIDIESKYAIKAEIAEGVIVKGSSRHDLWLCKVKTERYKLSLKAFYQADWIKHWE